MASTVEKNDKSIDLIKSIAILLVVMGHINTPFGKFIYSFHMPLFFIISGAFIKGENSFSQFQKDILTLIVPTIIFFLLGYYITSVKNIYLNREVENFYEALQNFFIWTDSKHIKNYGFVLWFLPVLFWGKLLTNISIFKNSKYEIVIILLVILILIILKNYFFFIIPTGIDIALFIVPFMLLGHLTYMKKNYIFRNSKYYFLISIIILFLINKIYGIQWLDIGAREYQNYTVSIVYSYLIFLLFFIIFNTVFLENKISNPLLFFGKNSLFIMIIHPYTNNISDKLVVKLFDIHIWPLSFLISIFIIVSIFFLYNYIFNFLKWKLDNVK